MNNYIDKHGIFKRGVIIYGIMLILICAGFLYLNHYINKKSNEMITMDITQGEDYSEEEFYAEIAKTQEWTGLQGTSGAEFKVTCYNNTNHEIYDWQVVLKIPNGSTLDNGWNGTYSISEEQMTYIPDQFNTTIFSRQPRTFGFIIYTPMKYVIREMTICGKIQYEIRDMPLFWILLFALCLVCIGIIFSILSASKEIKYLQKYKNDKKMIVQSMKTFTNFIDAKDPYTRGHSARVAKYTLEIAKRMGKNLDEQDELYYIALMHDVGKVGVPDDILNKPGKLSDEERAVIQTHTTLAETILKDFTAIPNIINGAKYHHERFDGKGYPSGLIGYNIPECARIICIADSFDAMSSDRCYRDKLPYDVILDELHQCAGTQFDPNIVKYMIQYVEESILIQKSISRELN